MDVRPETLPCGCIRYRKSAQCVMRVDCGSETALCNACRAARLRATTEYSDIVPTLVASARSPQQQHIDELEEQLRDELDDSRVQTLRQLRIAHLRDELQRAREALYDDND